VDHGHQVAVEAMLTSVLWLTAWGKYHNATISQQQQQWQHDQEAIAVAASAQCSDWCPWPQQQTETFK